MLFWSSELSLNIFCVCGTVYMPENLAVHLKRWKDWKQHNSFNHCTFTITFEQYPILTKWDYSNRKDLLSVYYVASTAQCNSHALNPCISHLWAEY